MDDDYVELPSLGVFEEARVVLPGLQLARAGVVVLVRLTVDFEPLGLAECFAGLQLPLHGSPFASLVETLSHVDRSPHGHLSHVCTCTTGGSSPASSTSSRRSPAGTSDSSALSKV